MMTTSPIETDTWVRTWRDVVVEVEHLLGVSGTDEWETEVRRYLSDRGLVLAHVSGGLSLATPSDDHLLELAMLAERTGAEPVPMEWATLKQASFTGWVTVDYVSGDTPPPPLDHEAGEAALGDLFSELYCDQVNRGGRVRQSYRLAVVARPAGSTTPWDRCEVTDWVEVRLDRPDGGAVSVDIVAPWGGE